MIFQFQKYLSDFLEDVFRRRKGGRGDGRKREGGRQKGRKEKRINKQK